MRKGIPAVDRRTVVAGIAAALATSTARRAAGSAEGIVETAHGKVRGTRVEGAWRFLCVPYGASTAGEGRFMPPRPPQPWAGVRDEPARRIIAPQVDPKAVAAPAGSLGAAISGIGSEAGSLESEDCLNVSIWTPGLDSKRRAVMFWAHGGGFFAGSGSAPMYDGARLASRGDVVVVNVTHRLNVLGHTHLPASGPAFAASGNAGMMDIELALRWVRDNIERFGGDPGRVLIYGQSGGGAKVSILMAMPTARGTFHRAAIQSGALRRVRDPGDGAEASAALLAKLGLKPTQAREAQRIPLEQLMAANFAYTREPAGPGRPNSFSPVLDGKLVPAHPFDPVANPLNADVPLIVGGTQTEQTAFSVRNEALFNLDDAGLTSRLRAQLGEGVADSAIPLYRRERPQASPSDLYFEILADRGRSSAIKLVELKTAQQAAPAWLYELTWRTPVAGGRLRSPHSLDLPLIFDIADGARWAPYTGGGSDAAEVARDMSRAWVSFAQKGTPDAATLPWPRYTMTARETMLFDRPSRALSDPFAATRRFWEDTLSQML